MKFSTAAAAACAPSMAYGLVGHHWNFDKTPTDGLRQVTFPYNVANAPHKKGFYYANQYSFQNSSIGYAGVQGRPDANGKRVLLFIFSSFVKGSTSDHPRCKDGADGGSGVSCSVSITGADYSHTYNVEVENVGGTTWRGTVVDTVSGARTYAGEYTLPSDAGGIKGSQVGFVEYFPWNSKPNHDCGTLPKTEVTFYDPTSSSSGAATGVITKPYEYGECKGKVSFSTNPVDGGWQVDVGF